MKVRQSLKGVKIAYVMVIILAALLAYFLWDSPYLNMAMALPVALLLFVAIRHLRRRATCLDVEGERLRYEAGLFSKTSRIMELAKVQDVRFDQTFGQRMIGTGDLSVETAGESSRIVMPSIDWPREVAEHILELSKAQRAK